MGKQIITLEDVLKAAQEGVKSIPASADGDIVTAQAREKAEELGISLPGQGLAAAPAAGGDTQAALVEKICGLMAERAGAALTPEALRRVVTEAVVARLGAAAAPARGGAGQYTEGGNGVYQVEFARLMRPSDGTGAGPGRAYVAEAVNCDCADLTGAYMEWEGATLPRTMEVPEIAVVLEGELGLISGGKTLTGRPGDMFYLSQGAQVEYAAKGKVRLACVSVKGC